MKQKTIDPIRAGTVIDHIKAGQALNVLKILNLDKVPTKEKISLSTRLSSTKFGEKDIIMFADLELDLEQLDAIALVAPDASVSTIRENEVVLKRKVSLPKLVNRFIVCPNPKCITNEEKIATKFDVEENGDVKVRCRYCEKEYSINKVEIKM